MYRFQILPPRADNSGAPFSGEDFARVKHELARQFAGVTAYLQAPAKRLWRERAQSSNDDLVIFEVMTETIGMADWRNRRAELERRFRQDEVIIRYLSVDRA